MSADHTGEGQAGPSACSPGLPVRRAKLRASEAALAEARKDHETICTKCGYVAVSKSTQEVLATMTKEREEWLAFKDSFTERHRTTPEGFYYDGLVRGRAEAMKAEADMRARKDTAYEERNCLVALVASLFPASLERHPDEDTAWENDWRWVVYVDLPSGQASWHIHDTQLGMFDHLPRLQGRKWDGHTTLAKYARIAAAIRAPQPPEPETGFPRETHAYGLPDLPRPASPPPPSEGPMGLCAHGRLTEDPPSPQCGPGCYGLRRGERSHENEREAQDMEGPRLRARQAGLSHDVGHRVVQGAGML